MLLFFFSFCAGPLTAQLQMALHQRATRQQNETKQSWDKKIAKNVIYLLAEEKFLQAISCSS